MSTERFSPIDIAVLALLYEAPMHPYRMQQLIKERGKDEVINVRQRASLYQTIDRLLRAKLIAIRETAREEKWPERTIYEISELGRAALLRWMRELLSTPVREYPAFPAVLAHLTLLTPEDVRVQLSQRAQALTMEIERVDGELRRGIGLIPRLFLLELEYLRATLSTELTWTQAIVEELAAGQLTWNEEWLRAIAAQYENRIQRDTEE
jgi:DNA-binding PadR family transcriptional regulator